MDKKILVSWSNTSVLFLSSVLTHESSVHFITPHFLSAWDGQITASLLLSIICSHLHHLSNRWIHRVNSQYEIGLQGEDGGQVREYTYASVGNAPMERQSKRELGLDLRKKPKKHTQSSPEFENESGTWYYYFLTKFQPCSR